MKKILQVVSCLEKGGTEAFIMNNFRNIDRNKFLFDFLVFIEKDYPYNNEIEKLGGNIYYCGTPNIKNLLGFIKKAVFYMKKGNYDAVHSHINISNAWVILAAFIAKIPIRISHSHATMKNCFDMYTIIRKFIIKSLSNVWLACSKIAGESLYGKRFFCKNGQIINNGIDVDKFLNPDKQTVANLKKQFNINDSDFVVGNITRFDKNKNIEFVVKVFYELLKLKPNSILILGGVDGGELTNIKNLVKNLNISDKVRFIGVRNDIEFCLQLMDVYIFPSINEGLGIAMLEAQAAGLYCFSSTGVPKETDMELGTVKFLYTSLGVDAWVHYVLKETENINMSDNETIKKQFADKGFYIVDSVKDLENIYDGGI